MKRHLMIIYCSDKKNIQPGLLPAIQRYKGAWYGVINKLKREGNLPDNLDILIISAKYGLINSEMLIENYIIPKYLKASFNAERLSAGRETFLLFIVIEIEILFPLQ